MRRSCIAVLLVALAGCSGDGGSTVSMTDERTFEPASLTVDVGDTVVWTNDSDDSHTVTSVRNDAYAFGSGNFDTHSQARRSLTEALIAPGDSFSFKFARAGTYEYFCLPHMGQGMTGTIIVEG